MKHVAEALRQETLQKYIKVCEKLNIDPIGPYSLKQVILFFSKSPNAICLAHSMFDDEQNDIDEWQDVLEEKSTIFNSINDWCCLFQYLDSHITASFQQFSETHAEHECSLQQLQLCIQTLQKFKLVESLSTDVSFAMKVFVYMSPDDTPASTMLERLVASLQPHHPDIEMRSLRVSSALMDQNLTQQERDVTLQFALVNMVIKPEFFTDVNKTRHIMELDTSAFQREFETHKRPQLRRIVKTVVKQSHGYKYTMSSWISACLFSAGMSKHLQALLYFMMVQPCQFDANVFEDNFPPHVQKRIASLPKIDEIDLDAIVTTIQSIRVYRHNVKHLIDFRAETLHGMSATTRKQITMPMAMQLYVCCFQHPSVWQQCWSCISPDKTINHSTIELCQRFRAKYKYEAEAVVNTLTWCHRTMDKKRIETMLPSLASADNMDKCFNKDDAND